MGTKHEKRHFYKDSRDLIRMSDKWQTQILVMALPARIYQQVANKSTNQLHQANQTGWQNTWP